jgi:AcrR family transcriptional regulator
MNTNGRALSIRTFVRKIERVSTGISIDVADGRRVRGDASRRAVLAAAVDLASVEGLDQLSIGRIAEAASVSKSGVATLFGNKERLQLATVEAARLRFVETVVEPARELPRGLGRVVSLVDHWIAYSRGRVFPGGCFFAEAAVDFDAKPGPVHDAIDRAMADWSGYLAASLAHARSLGELPALEDPDQLAFEFTALLDLANRDSVMRGTNASYARARAGVAARPRAAGGTGDALDAFAAASDARPARPTPARPDAWPRVRTRDAGARHAAPATSVHTREPPGVSRRRARPSARRRPDPRAARP